MPNAYMHHERLAQQHVKSRVWSYPDDRVVFRSGMRVRQHRPTRSRDSPSPYDLDNDSEDEDTTNPSLRGPKEDGALSMLPKMPVDVLYEIFSHLHAKDVLSLSRTTHGLRAILMDRHARSVWKSSLGNVWALPVCPSDLTEPQYANLTFDEHCHFCSAPRVEEIFWSCRVRCCKKCIDTQFIPEDELDILIPEEVYIEKLDSIFPCITQRRNGGREIRPFYFVPKVKEYLQELNDVAHTRNDESLEEWSREKKDLQAMRSMHAALCEYWYAHWAYRRAPRMTPSRTGEIVIIAVLLLILGLLWKDHVAALIH